MSAGLLICSICKREVHQDGENHSWRHCEDLTPICEQAGLEYPTTNSDIVGEYCGRDENPYAKWAQRPPQVQAHRGAKAMTDTLAHHNSREAVEYRGSLIVIQPTDCTELDEDCLEMEPCQHLSCYRYAPESGRCPFVAD